MRWPLLAPLLFPLFYPTLVLSSSLSITYIFQGLKSCKLYMSTTYKDTASFLQQGKEGVN